MGAAYFYHLTRRSLEETLPVLLDKALGAGWRIVVRGVDLPRITRLDERLWLGAEDQFLPHGLVGGPHDALQPVLLSHETTLVPGTSCLMTVDGAEVTAEEVTALERVCILFDGTNPDAVARARVQWKSLTDAGCSAQYWSEESGRWEKKAEKTAGGD
ncbi:DNA polymerase III, chi subunit [Phaeobacter inhibens]|uniref:DNA polymerase III subunit chi n=1 Tax=Phaeobacter inhibens TaxID=221822 RepID=UPI000C9B9880|nr:DNA polymerase III subunit chi [Phaeobacter inhibens]AUR03971.1 DNA polymerase III, chi subunit [Phaeobacter inhibens]